MRVALDIEANGITPDKIWCVCCIDIDTGVEYVFHGRSEFLAFANGVTRWIGHNIVSYDMPVLNNLYGLEWTVDQVTDTYLISKLANYPRKKHSIEDYGVEFGYPKSKFDDWTKYSPELEERCIIDTRISVKIYNKYLEYIDNPLHQDAIKLEHTFQLLCNDFTNKGFHFNTTKANKLLDKVSKELTALDKTITDEFKPRQVLVREFTPKATKHGTISKTSVPRSLWSNIHEFEVGKTYPVYREQVFNPSSPKQVVTVLREAGWKPVDKTTTHTEALRQEARGVLQEGKLEGLRVTGWKINENNLKTLPADAPAPARSLAKRILLESRRRTLTEWLELVTPESRIHGKFYGIGAWTHRMAHRNPNTANIPREFHEDGTVKLLGKELRELWCAPPRRLLVGVDAEGIQLRIFAHYIDDKEFTEALVKGKKSDKTDPHSLNQRIIGTVCKSRQAAKRFIFALLLGGGLGKFAEILQCSREDASAALETILGRYQGLEYLRESVFPADAKRGWFTAIDGRPIIIPGDTISNRRHLLMSGYLQSGEAIVMKRLAVEVAPHLPALDSFIVGIAHDELQNETPNRMDKAIAVAELEASTLIRVGEIYKLRCPLAGSYWSEDTNDYTIGTNWYQTH